MCDLCVRVLFVSCSFLNMIWPCTNIVMDTHNPLKWLGFILVMDMICTCSIFCWNRKAILNQCTPGKLTFWTQIMKVWNMNLLFHFGVIFSGDFCRLFSEQKSIKNRRASKRRCLWLQGAFYRSFGGPWSKWFQWIQWILSSVTAAQREQCEKSEDGGSAKTTFGPAEIAGKWRAETSNETSNSLSSYKEGTTQRPCIISISSWW